ncbi:MAG: hypothetical protein MJ249_15715 [Kiritimatiellae bacterium]|nr:hypothetical protein [Kiritimatiellia bacterium]
MLKCSVLLLTLCSIAFAFAEDAPQANLPKGGPFVNASQFPANANPNAYYWVDVVTKDAGEVVFTGDRPCNLPDPKFETKGGLTNRVILLIGKPYTVTTKSKVSVVGKSSPDIKVLVKGDKTVRIQRPLVFNVGQGPFVGK